MDTGDVFETWVQQYAERLVRIAYMYVKNRATAEDCAQDALLRAFKSRRQLRDPDNPFPWLVRIVVNQCKTASKRNLREVLMSLLPEKTTISTEDVYIKNVDADVVYRAVLALSDKYRIPIVLYYFEGFTVQQISEIMSTPPDTIKTQLFRGRQKLKQIIDEGGDAVEYRRGVKIRKNPML